MQHRRFVHIPTPRVLPRPAPTPYANRINTNSYWQTVDAEVCRARPWTSVHVHHTGSHTKAHVRAERLCGTYPVSALVRARVVGRTRQRTPHVRAFVTVRAHARNHSRCEPDSNIKICCKRGRMTEGRGTRRRIAEGTEARRVGCSAVPSPLPT
eukprot:15432316-Alexandrium_andersonii.AAC.1